MPSEPHSDCDLPPGNHDHRTLGLVMAAGFSRRFGGEDKRTAPLATGGTLLARTLARLLPAFTPASGECLLAVVIRPGDCPSALGIPVQCPILRAPNAGHGLGASIADAMRGIREMPLIDTVDSIAILLGDMPAIRAQTLSDLIHFSRVDTIVRPYYRGQPGHPVIFGRKFWPQLRTVTGEQGARQVVNAHASGVLAVAVDDPGILLDVDNKAALDCLPVCEGASANLQ